MPYPVKFVTIGKASELLGYSKGAIHAKIDNGVWLEGVHWTRAPDGRRLIDLGGIEQWAEGGGRIVG